MPMFDERVESGGMHFNFRAVISGYKFGLFCDHCSRTTLAGVNKVRFFIGKICESDLKLSCQWVTLEINVCHPTPTHPL